LQPSTNGHADNQERELRYVDPDGWDDLSPGDEVPLDDAVQVEHLYDRDTEDTEDTSPKRWSNDAPIKQEDVSSVCSVSSVSSVSVPEYLLAVAEAAAGKELPPEAERYYLPAVKRLVGICRELQVAAGERTWCLGCRQAGALLGVNHRVAWRWLLRLEKDDVIQRVSTGRFGTHRANEYRYGLHG
jgi:hypothetical protein